MLPYYTFQHYTEVASSEYAPPKQTPDAASMLSTVKDEGEEPLPHSHLTNDAADAQAQPDPLSTFPQSFCGNDSDCWWQGFQGDDLIHPQTDEASDNALAGLASLNEHDTLVDDTAVEDSRFRQKRQREDDDTFIDSKRPSICQESIRNAREQMDSLVEEQKSAMHCLERAQSQLQISRQHVNDADATLQQANRTVLEASHQLCDELLQERTFWNDTYKLLVQFREAYGHANVPRNPSKEQKEADPNLSKLAGWVGRQRTNYRRPAGDARRPEPYQIVALQRTGFDFDPHRTSWMKWYAEIKAFKATHGHFDVSSVMSDSNATDDTSSSTSSNDSADEPVDNNDPERYRSLASWVRRQQYQYKLFRGGNTKSEMSEERISLLEEIGFPWRKREESWMERYNAFRVHQQEDGNACKKLYDWIKNQSRQLKLYQEDPSTSTLSKDQAKLLSQLSLDDLNSRANSWSTRFDQLMEFKKQHGHCVIPCKYPLNQKLASWVGTQRRQYQLRAKGETSQITEERIKTLTKAGFEWTVSAARREEIRRTFVKTWDELFAEIQEMRNETGMLDVDKSHDLREWFITQRKQYQLWKEGRPTQLSAAQLDKLQALGIDVVSNSMVGNSKGGNDECEPPPTSEVTTNPPQSQANRWENFYTDLLTHRLRHNSFQVPTAHKLHNWTQEQRLEYDKYINGRPSVLTRERIRKLNFVGFQWDENGRSSSEDPIKSWEEMFAELLAFRIRFQSFRVSPEDNPDLHGWMASQRSMLVNHLQGNEQSSLVVERIRKLQEIGFPWGECMSTANRQARIK